MNDLDLGERVALWVCRREMWLREREHAIKFAGSIAGFLGVCALIGFCAFSILELWPGN